MLTRKHFKIIADALRESKPEVVKGRPSELLIKQWDKDVEALAEALQQTNPSFTKERFYEACGVQASRA